MPKNFIEIILHDLYVKDHKVQIPLKCPKCKHSLVGRCTIIEIGSKTEKQYLSIDEDGDISDYSSGESCEGGYSHECRCGHCDHILASGKEVTLPDDFEMPKVP